jgi:uncharacterized protein
MTHPKIFDPPSSTGHAIDQIDAWLESPSLELLREGRDHWPMLSRLLAAGKVRGPMVHDARIAALCLSHEVRELLTADRDFSRFGSLRTRNPVVS